MKLVFANFVAERVLGGVSGYRNDANGNLINLNPLVEKALTNFANEHTAWYDAILTHIKDMIAKLKGIYYSITHKDAKQQNESKELEEIYRRLVQLKDTVNTKKAAQADGQYSVQEIFDENGNSYGIGVVLDSQKLNNLSEQERIDKVKEHIKNLGNVPFVAFDPDGNEVQIKIAPKTKYKNSNGKQARANSHLINYLKSNIKQETLFLIDEVIEAATYQENESPEHSHGWLDNNGQNDWEIWTTYIQDKEKTIWKARLKVANSQNGDKVLYEVYPIEKVGQDETLSKSTTEDNISQATQKVKEKQFEIIQATNPMWDDYHTGIRSVDDIRTWDEVLQLDDKREGQFVWGDFSREDAENALKENSITVYSSHPIENGTFVSTSYVQAQEYAGGRSGDKVYSKTIPLDVVAWINGDEGQYANVNEGTSDTTVPTQDGQAYVPSSSNADLLEQYEQGKLTREQYQAEVAARDKKQTEEVRKLRQQKTNLQEARKQLQERFKNQHGGWNESKSLEVLRGILKQYPTKVVATKLVPAYMFLANWKIFINKKTERSIEASILRFYLSCPFKAIPALCHKLRSCVDAQIGNRLYPLARIHMPLHHHKPYRLVDITACKYHKEGGFEGTCNANSRHQHKIHKSYLEYCAVGGIPR